MKDQVGQVTELEPKAPVQEEAQATVPFLSRSMSGKPMVVRTSIKAGEEGNKVPHI